MTDTYRVKVGDLEYPAEFSNPIAAYSVAKGARFALDNSTPKNVNYPSHIPITVTTYTNTYDSDNDTDVVTEVRTTEV